MWSLFSVVLTLLSFSSAVPIWATIAGDVAWNGVNFAVVVYLLLATGGTLAILAGFPAAFRSSKLLVWVTIGGAVAITVLATVFAYGFIWERNRDLPFNSPFYIAGIHAPEIAFYGTAVVLCIAEAFLYWARLRNSKDSN